MHSLVRFLLYVIKTHKPQLSIKHTISTPNSKKPTMNTQPQKKDPEYNNIEGELIRKHHITMEKGLNKNLQLFVDNECLGKFSICTIEKALRLDESVFESMPSVYYNAIRHNDVQKVEWLVKNVGTFTDEPDKLVFGGDTTKIPNWISTVMFRFEPLENVRIRHMLTRMWTCGQLDQSIAMLDCLDRYFHDFRPKLLDVLCAMCEICMVDKVPIEFPIKILNRVFPDGIAAAIEEEMVEPRTRTCTKSDHWSTTPPTTRQEDIIRHADTALRNFAAMDCKTVCEWLVENFPVLRQSHYHFNTMCITYEDRHLPAQISAINILHELLDTDGAISINMALLIGTTGPCWRYTKARIDLSVLKHLVELRPHSIKFHWGGLKHFRDKAPVKAIRRKDVELLKREAPDTYKYVVEHRLLPNALWVPEAVANVTRGVSEMEI